MNSDGRLNWDQELRKAANGSKPPEPVKQSDDEEMLGPCVWIWTRGCKAIDIERGAEDVETFHFVHTGVKSSFARDGSHFTLIFAGLQVWKITVCGRNLRDVFNRVNDQCVRKLRVGDRDFGQTDKPFISKIEIHDITPKE